MCRSKVEYTIPIRHRLQTQIACGRRHLTCTAAAAASRMVDDTVSPGTTSITDPGRWRLNVQMPVPMASAAPVVPVRLPTYLRRSGAHGTDMLLTAAGVRTLHCCQGCAASELTGGCRTTICKTTASTVHGPAMLLSHCQRIVLPLSCCCRETVLLLSCCCPEAVRRYHWTVQDYCIAHQLHEPPCCPPLSCCL